MRVTENGLASSFLASINGTRERIVDLQSQLATGKAVQKSSDNPGAMAIILRLNNSIDRNEQFQKNVSDAQSMIDNTQAGLDGFSNIMTQLKTILTTSNNSANTESLGALADQVDALLTDAVNIGNSKFNGKYIFGGTNTLDPPFRLAADRSAVTLNPNGITGTISYQIGEGTTQAVNIDGQEAFLGTQMFDLIVQIRDTMRNGQIPTTAQSNAVGAMLDHVTAETGKAGSIANLLSTSETLLGDQNTQLRSLLSNQQDTDIAEATMKLKQEQTMLDAALNTGASIIPKSLLDYMK